MVSYRFFYVAFISSILLTPLLSQGAPTKKTVTDTATVLLTKKKEPIAKKKRRSSGVIKNVRHKSKSQNLSSSIIKYLKNNKKISKPEQETLITTPPRRIHEVLSILEGFRIINVDYDNMEKKEYHSLLEQFLSKLKISHCAWEGKLKPLQWFENNEMFLHQYFFLLFSVGTDENDQEMKLLVSDIEPETYKITNEEIRISENNEDISHYLCRAAMRHFNYFKDKIKWSNTLKGYSEQIALYLNILSFLATKIVSTSPDVFQSTHITIKMEFFCNLTSVELNRRRRVYEILAVLKSLGLIEKRDTGIFIMNFTSDILPKYTDFFGFEDASEFDLNYASELNIASDPEFDIEEILDNLDNHLR